MNPSISLFYDYDPDGEKRPIWLSINFGFEGVPWNTKSLYVDISQFESIDVHDFYDEYIGCSILISELFATSNEREIGINLAALYERLKSSVDPVRIDRFIIQVSDAVEIKAIGKEMVL